MDTESAVLLTIIIMLVLFAILAALGMTWKEFTSHIKRLLNFLTKPFRHKTKLEKEIAKTQKEINLLKKQKDDIDRLQKLKDEERDLFEEVQDYEERE